ncbi:DUF1254 domain-containing protein [Tuwongella immobilis]|uniref:Cell envelope protein n=1 Tax=Tuwongella immobilis TaxID=692036 RepID=A0A6C2YSV3_9BACT|nr:DUF1254 domain-containing protein [Tuwongella immobilis]VIP04536.1 Uncharacterized protein OS=Planctomyces limnophilus (strain ATCC 43296 / DSM 3776 / IFAM 1008 / 290) GN=Plim_1467 PE=4 SV=1: DUF1254: DUF1214 [Tuwongella immobilis]VTS06433.1 Uncharacterized protein OS=Planctomyces limnophilus (strain ATCC 43296 / DSM 3776 / IFAM 1008 / 290) GN=Plim_1467 PE=4 SV=1: DUF1254: DUF1214 [Tuwongella immobilis]
MIRCLALLGMLVAGHGAGVGMGTVQAQSLPPVAEFQAIAEEAMLYGYPLVMNYKVIYESYIDQKSSQYRGPLSQLVNTGRVFTPKDTSVVTPNSDTPYSFFCADLRAEPMVLTLPKIDASRYVSVQLVDWYTANYGYLGSRTTGNGGGNYLLVGPDWKGEQPKGIDRVFRCETEFTFAIIRTQLFSPNDLDNVRTIQAGYRLQPLSKFLGESAPAPSAAVKWPAITSESADANLLSYAAFLLQFCPPVGTAAVEVPLRERFARIGLVAGKPFEAEKLPAEYREALKAAKQAANAKIKDRVLNLGKNQNGWRVGAAFGNRAFYRGDWLARAASAAAGIYGNDAAEALYPMLTLDADGKRPDCTTNRYVLTFPAGKLPPVDAFWSVTMYDATTQLLVENPLNRYLINSPMLPDLKRNADGSLSILISHESPGKDWESNWLPAPKGPIFVVMRLYRPQAAALSGDWQPPPVVRMTTATPAK